MLCSSSFSEQMFVLVVVSNVWARLRAEAERRPGRVASNWQSDSPGLQVLWMKL